jgi:hypothetical protein
MAELVPRRRRLLDVAAPPCLALLDLIPKTPENLAVLEIGPGDAEGRVRLRLASQFWMAELDVEGEAEKRLAIPRWALAQLARRGPDAERLVADDLSTGGIGWRVFSTSATVVLGAPQAELLPEDLPLLRLPWPAAPSTTLPVCLNPAYLKRAVTVAERLEGGHLKLVTFPRSPVGAVLLISSQDVDGVHGSIQLARMIPTTEAAA